MYSPRGERGSTLLDAVVGSALMLLVFVGIVGAFRLSVIAVSNNKARAGAIALANERLEYVRSLPYNSVGTVGGIPSGAIAQTETMTLNDVAYTRRTFISYEDDPADGLGAADTNNIRTDYKAAKSSVSWQSRDGTHTLTLVSRISPPGIETNVPGGTLSFNVINAASVAVSNAAIRIVNGSTSPAIDLTTYTDNAGLASVLGVPPASGYRITVTKAGYSSAQTYSASSTNANPTPAHLGVALNQTTAATFAIDVLSSKTLETYTAIMTGTTTETFASGSGLASSTNIIVISGVARLVTLDGAYPPSGMFLSVPVSTSTLSSWKSFSFVQTKPASTNIVYRLYDASGALIPDAQLAGNSAGFTASPVNLTSVSTSSYSSLVVGATLTTSNPAATPSIDSYSLTMDTGPRSLPNLNVTLRGAKTIGTTQAGALVYKYNNTTVSSGASGIVTLANLEWDTYTTSVNASTTYTISSACGPQPEFLAPNSSQTTRLFVSTYTTHSLLVDVKNSAGATIPNASVRLYRTASPASDTTKQSDGCGNGFFSGLASGTSGGGNPYSIQVSASGYQTFTSTTVNVSGISRLSVILNN